MKTGLSKFFNEILYEAEMNREEDSDPEAIQAAYDLCGEQLDTRTNNIEKLRELIRERGECHPPRLDDAFLLRFLRARKSIPARAHKLLVHYCNFREENPQLWRDVDWFQFTKMGSILRGVLYDRPDVGRLFIVKLSEWDPDKITAPDFVSAVLVLLEIAVMQPKIQILGGSMLVDCEGLSMRHIRAFSPADISHCFNLYGYAFPVHHRGIHVINISRFFRALFPVFKRFAPAENFFLKVHFHGYDLASLHQHIDPECLPAKYGGKREEISVQFWLTKIKQYKDEQFDRDLRKLGYATEH